MILFNVMSLQFLADNDTINWTDKTITIRDNIKLIQLTITHYPDLIYKIKKANEIVYNWNKFIKYWNKHHPEYNSVLNIEFDKLILDIDYSLAPIYNNNNNIYIGIYIFNNEIIKKMNNSNVINSIINKQDLHKLNYSKKSYSFLSRIEPYVLSLSNIKKSKTMNTTTTNKYNFIYDIVNNSNNIETLQNKEFILDTNINISLKYILQNSMNYLPKLEIKRIKMSSQNLLNP